MLGFSLSATAGITNTLALPKITSKVYIKDNTRIARMEDDKQEDMIEKEEMQERHDLMQQRRVVIWNDPVATHGRDIVTEGGLNEGSIFTMITEIDQIRPTAIGKGGLFSTIMFGDKYLTVKDDRLALTPEKSLWQAPDFSSPLFQNPEFRKQAENTLTQGSYSITFFPAQ